MKVTEKMKKAGNNVAAALYNVAVSKAVGKTVVVRPTRVFARPTLKRAGVLEGEENIFDVIYGYSYAMNKKIYLDPVLDDARRILPKLPKNYRELIEDQIQYAKGKYGLGDRIWDSILQALIPTIQDTKREAALKKLLLPAVSRMKPAGVSRGISIARAGEGIIKLGYRPVAAGVNWASGHWHTQVKVGTKYFMKGWAFKDTPEFQAFMKKYPWALGISLEHDLTSGTLGAHKWYKPLGMFGAPEPQIRKVCLAANYLYLKEVVGIKDQALLERETRRAMRLQNFTYNLAALPHILRSPLGRLIGQYKPYLVFELQFMSTLTPKEWARYALMQVVLGGPRGMCALAKSIPLFVTLFGLATGGDDPDDWLDKHLRITTKQKEWDLSRGIVGLFGGDISIPATFQFPKEFDDWAGPFFSDLIKMYRVIHQKAAGLDWRFVAEDLVDAILGLSPAMHYWSQLWDSVFSPDGYVRDRRGYKLYKPTTLDKLLFLPSGVAPTSYKEIRQKERRVRESRKELETNRNRAIATIARYLIKMYCRKTIVTPFIRLSPPIHTIRNPLNCGLAEKKSALKACGMTLTLAFSFLLNAHRRANSVSAIKPSALLRTPCSKYLRIAMLMAGEFENGASFSKIP